jgi:sporulation protein YunB
VRKAGIYIFIAVMIIVVWTAFLFAVVNPTVANYAQAELEALTVKAVNSGVTDVVETHTYSELIDVRRKENGSITSINVDMVKTNKIASDIATKSQNYLDNMAAGGLDVPIGTFSGVPILVGKGHIVKLKIKLIGSVNCRFDSSFVSGGINQTRHSMSLYVDTIVSVVLPLYTKRTEVAIQMLFCESIIIGDVPSYIIP